MITPPHPGFQGTTLSVVRRLVWSPVDVDVGELVGGWLAIAGCSEGPALWCAGEQHAPAGLAPRLVAKDAFAAMRDGKVQQDGSLAWNGQRYDVVDVADGGRMVARLLLRGTT
jgi:hypothetical protein